MADSFTKLKLSGSTNGRNVNVDATSTPGTLIHTAHATALDEVWLWCCNIDTTDRKLTLELGGTTAGDDGLEVTIPAESGWVLVIPGMVYTGSVVIRAFGALADALNISGYVNRITQT